ncbi:hypothetical protein EON64_14220 [archaeon]|nr:MAG: hypothetical protein EON64_14220 [archaeon]
MDPTKKELYTAKRSAGINTDDPDVVQAVQRLKEDSDPTNWLLMRVENNTILKLVSSGSGGVGELISNLTADDIFYGAVKAMVDGKVKFFHVYVVGENVAAMKKGKGSLHKGAAFQAVEAHGELNCSVELSELTRDYMVGEIVKLTRCRPESIDV